MNEFLQWFVPLFLGIVVAPFINRLANKPSESDNKVKEAQASEDITQAAKTSVEIMEIVMKRVEKANKDTTNKLKELTTKNNKDIRMLTRKVVRLQDDLKKESQMRRDCQKVLSKLAAKNNITMPSR